MKTILRYTPKAQYITRSAFRLLMAGSAYALGYPAAGHVLIVIAVLSLIGPIEIAIAQDVSSAIKRQLSDRNKACQCRVCDGRGQLSIPDEHDDDNCCTVCAGTGLVKLGKSRISPRGPAQQPENLGISCYQAPSRGLTNSGYAT